MNHDEVQPCPACGQKFYRFCPGSYDEGQKIDPDQGECDLLSIAVRFNYWPASFVVDFPDGTGMDVYPPPWDYDHTPEEQLAYVRDVIAPFVFERKLTGDIVAYEEGL